MTTDAQIKQLLESAKTIGVVGLLDKPHRPSHAVSAYMQAAGYSIIPINPMIATALGLKAYPDLLSLPADVSIDIVNIFRRSEFVPAVVDRAIAIKAKAVWMQLGVIHPAAAVKAEAAGLIVVMDRCIKVEHHRLL